MLKLEILNASPLADIRYAALATKGKLSLQSPKDMERFAMEAVIAEHSVLAEARIRITDDNCRSDVVSHLVRHTKGHPRHYVQSKRPDWTGEPRPSSSSAPRIYVSTWPADALLSMSHQRLCHLASKWTRTWAMNVKVAFRELFGDTIKDDPAEFAWAMHYGMVPSCVYRGGCPEGKRTCCYWNRMEEEYRGMELEDRMKFYSSVGGASESIQQIPTDDV